MKCRETYPDQAKRGVQDGPTPAKYSVRPMVPFPVQSITLYQKSAKNLSKQERRENSHTINLITKNIHLIN